MFAIKEYVGTLTTLRKAIILGTPIALVGGLVYSKYKSNGATKNSILTAEADGKSNEKVTKDVVELTQNVDFSIIKAAGNKNFRRGKYRRSIECFTEAIRICPAHRSKDIAICYQNRAAAHEQLNNVGNVISDCSKAIQYDKLYVKAYRRRASIYESLKMYLEAFNGYRHSYAIDRKVIVALDKGKAPISTMAAKKLLTLASMERAKHCFKSLEPTIPSKQYVRNYLESYFNDPITPKTLGHAEGDTTCSLFVPPTIQSESINAAITSGEFGIVLDLVAAELSDLNESDPMTLKRQYLYLVQATFLMLIGDFTQCHVMLDKLIMDGRVDSRYASNALLKRASVHILEDKCTEAFGDIEMSLQFYPTNVDVFYHKAQLHLITKNMDEAIVNYQKVCAMCPTFGVAHAHYCFALSRRAFIEKDGELLERSNREFTKFIQRFSSVSLLHSFYGQSLMDQKKYQEAYDMFTASLQISPTDIGTICQLATLIMKWKKDESRSINMLKEAVILDDKSTMPLELLGKLAFDKSTDEALTYFRRALDICTRKDDIALMYSLILETEAHAAAAALTSD